MNIATCTRLSMDPWLGCFETCDLHVEPGLSGRMHLDHPRETDFTRSSSHLLRLVLAGQGTCTYRTEGDAAPGTELPGQQQIPLTPGTAIWVQPGVVHGCCWDQPAQLLQVVFDVQQAGRIARVSMDCLYSHEGWSVREKLEQILDELALPMPQSPRRVRWLLGLAVTDVMRQHSRYRQAEGLSATQRSRLTQFVASRGVEPTFVVDLAQLLGLSEDYFARRFRQTFGQSPQAWLIRQRMLAAGRIMRDTGATATQVAQAAGYTDLSQFSRQFRRTLGVSPSHYRRG